jgi:hypothetical protein
MTKSYSYSKIAAYLDCPFFYKCRYIDRIPYTLPESTLVGIKVHKAIQVAINLYKQGKLKWNTCSDIMDLLNSPQVNVGSFKIANECCSILKGFNINKFPIDNLYQTELKLKLLLGKHLINSVIDRLDVVDNTLHIIEYKTGKPHAKVTLQDKIYSITVGTSFRRYDLVQISKYFVRHDNVVKIYVKNFNNYKNEILRYINELECDNKFLPKKNWMCDNCCYKKLCNIT